MNNGNMRKKGFIRLCSGYNRREGYVLIEILIGFMIFTLILMLVMGLYINISSYSEKQYVRDRLMENALMTEYKLKSKLENATEVDLIQSGDSELHNGQIRYKYFEDLQKVVCDTIEKKRVDMRPRIEYINFDKHRRKIFISVRENQYSYAKKNAYEIGNFVSDFQVLDNTSKALKLRIVFSDRGVSLSKDVNIWYRTIFR